MRLGVPPAPNVPEAPVGMRADHCDDKRRIVYGTIADELSSTLHNTFQHGAKLAASYRRLLECRYSLQKS